MIVLDVEASGLNPKADSIVSIGALDSDNQENRFYGECRVWEGAHVHEEALAINGFTKESLEDVSKQTEAELVSAFVIWALEIQGDRTLAAQNVSFDFSFIEAACERAGVHFPFAKRTLDVHSLVWMHMTVDGVTPPLQNNHSAISLDSALTYCGLPSEQKPHNALTGALAHAEVVSRVAYNKLLLPEYSTFPIPWSYKTTS
jgi:DNA polymerase III epsilon subunit-like protein